MLLIISAGDSKGEEGFESSAILDSAAAILESSESDILFLKIGGFSSEFSSISEELESEFSVAEHVAPTI